MTRVAASLSAKSAETTDAASDSFASAPVFTKGFRPFFLLAAISAVLLLPTWLLVLGGVLHPLPTQITPIYWHAHEMVFGFAAAVIAGFLLTAVSNWTNRETAIGWPLIALCTLWVFGRVAMVSAALLPRFAPAIVDLAFLPTLMIVLARPLLAAKSRRNFIMLGVLAALFGANVMIHLDVLELTTGWQRRGVLLSVDIIVLLSTIIAGRVVPMFTRNVTAKHAAEIRSIPVLDVMTIALMAVLTLLDAFSNAEVHVIATIAGIVGVLAAVRSIYWGAKYSVRTPLLWILHLGYLWIPIGLLLRAAGSWLEGTPLLAMSTHALTAGALGSLTLAMMVRVALGHTGRTLTASKPIVLAFVMITLAAVSRVAAPLLPMHYLSCLIAAGVFWSLAFVLYLVVFAPILTSPRADER